MKFTCYDSNRDVYSVIYHPTGNALTHAEIVDLLNHAERKTMQDELTPVHGTPSHVDEVGEHYSRVFHQDHPGRIVAVFHGENHRADSEAYCAWAVARSMMRVELDNYKRMANDLAKSCSGW